MTKRPFHHHRQAALTLLSQSPDLARKTAGFLGQVCVEPVLSEKQRNWLVKLLECHGLPPLAEGGAE